MMNLKNWKLMMSNDIFKKGILIDDARSFAERRFGNTNQRKSSAIAQEQYACRVGFYAGVEWQKEYSRISPTAIESLIQVLGTPIAKRKGITLSAEECKVWIEMLKH